MNQGWECPKCGRVWGPLAQECVKCNAQAKQQGQEKKQSLEGNTWLPGSCNVLIEGRGYGNLFRCGNTIPCPSHGLLRGSR